MSLEAQAMNILRKSFLRRINFSFPGGAGTFTIDGGFYAAVADKIGLPDTDPDKINVVIKKNKKDLGGFDDVNTIKLDHGINGREMEAVVCHEATHVVLFFNDTNKNVLSANEEAACYVVNVCYYLMTGLSIERWRGPKGSGPIKTAALPIAYSILNANTGGQSNVSVDAPSFQRVVSAASVAYIDYAKSNDENFDPTQPYPRYGDSATQ